MTSHYYILKIIHEMGQFFYMFLSACENNNPIILG